MSAHLDDDQWELRKDPDVAWTLGKYLSEGSVAKTYVTGLGLLSRGEAIAVADALEQQLGALERQLYTDAVFWFCPNWKNLSDLAAVTGARHFAEDAWYLYDTRPAVGQRRGRRRASPRSWSPPRQWPELGRWQVTAFPQAVAWLKQWIKETLAEITSLQQEFDRTVASLEQRIDQLVKTSRQIVRRQRYLGDLPIKRSRVVHPAFQAYDRRRGMYTVPAETEDQVYDRVEELDQTHADRRLELATDLVRLPAFTAYCRTEDGQYRLRLPPPTAVDPDWQRSCMERIRQTSKHQIGLPPESSAPRTPRPADGLPPSVSRYHPDEPKP